MTSYVAVAGEDEVGEGEIKAFVIGGREIAVARCDGELHAIDNICSHAYTHLSEGEIDTDDCVVECPLHGARFDLRSGRVRALPATEPIETFPVRVVDGQIEVGLPN